MSNHTDRITAALEAADKATPGKWEVVEDVFGEHPDIRDSEGRLIATVRREFPMSEERRTHNAKVLAAAPDMAAEIVKLRKWQSEAADYLGEARAYYADKAELWKGRDREKQYQLHVDVIDRLIAEAKEQGE